MPFLLNAFLPTERTVGHIRLDALPLCTAKEIRLIANPRPDLMSETADLAARTQRFNDAARTFTPPSPMRHAKLIPMKDGIIELRQKGASLRVIRELLATVDVAVGIDTIARFLAEVNGEASPARPRRRSGYRRTASAAATQESPPALTPGPPPQTEPPAERSRTRGPRVADPRNL